MGTSSAVAQRALRSDLSTDGADQGGAAVLLGGARLLRRMPATRAEVHAKIVDGIPYSALFFLTDHVTVLSEEDVANVVGISKGR